MNKDFRDLIKQVDDDKLARELLLAYQRDVTLVHQRVSERESALMDQVEELLSAYRECKERTK